MMPDVVLVTGASGFIGQAVVPHLVGKGYRVRALVRPTTPWPFAPHPQLERVVGDLRDAASLERASAGVDGVVHLAAAKLDEPDSEQINVEGARHLASACRINGVRFLINVSTQSAKLRQPGLYGRTKAAADAVFHASAVPTTTLRASLVYGDLTSGAFGALVRITRLPIIPLIGTRQPIFRPIHRDDLASAIARAARQPATRGHIYDVGGPDAVSLRHIIQATLAQRRQRRVFVRVPRWAALAAAHAVAWWPRPPVTVSNVRGAYEELSMDVERFFQAVGYVPRRFEEGLADIFAEERSRHAAADARDEAVLLLRYVLSSTGASWAPSSTDLERYRAALRAQGVSQQHQLGVVVARHPWLLGSLDALSRIRYPHGALQQKLLVAAAIAECQPLSASRLLPRDRHPAVMLVDACWLMGTAAVKWAGALPLLLCPGFVRRCAGVS